MEGDKKCDNCKLNIAAQNYVMHTLHCARHLELCAKCREPVPKDQMKEHLAREHGNENCSACGETMEKSALEQHSQIYCKKRIISCPYCELELPSCDMEKHTEYCGTRTEKCSDCGELVMLKYMQLHLDSNHNFLKLDDEPGPVASWKTRETAAPRRTPTNEDILLPCEFCDEMFTPRELRRHEVSCELGWRTTIPVLRRMSIVTCDLCNKPIATTEYQAHRNVCSKPLPSRKTLVPCDVCNESIPFEDYELHLVICHQKQELQESEARNPRRVSLIPCEMCNEPIAFKDYQVHHAACFPSPRLRRSPLAEGAIQVLPCEHCGESFSPGRLVSHQTRCGMRSSTVFVPCEVCGELKAFSEIVQHQLACRADGDF